jgi:hypothetical protein
MAVRLSASRAGRPLPPGRFLVHISVKGWIEPRVMVRQEGLGKLKNPMTSSEIESVNFRLFLVMFPYHALYTIILSWARVMDFFLSLFFDWIFKENKRTFCLATFFYYILNKDWCISSCGFGFSWLSPDKNCILAMCNKQPYSLHFPLSNLFGMFRFEIMVRNFQDQNSGVSSWEKWTFPAHSPLRVQSRLRSCRGQPKHLCCLRRRLNCRKKSPQIVFAL